MTEPGAAELDALLEALDTQPETATLFIPISPAVVRWLLRGVFVDARGHEARLVGATIRGNELTPVFRETCGLQAHDQQRDHDEQDRPREQVPAARAD